MSFLVRSLFVAFFVEQVYAVMIHFPRPSSGLVYQVYYQLLKACVATTVMLSLTPIMAPNPLYIALPSSLIFLASLTLFAWAGATTRPGKFAVIFGRVTPTHVVSTGPFTYIRHPTYVSYALGWIATVLVVLHDSFVSKTETSRWISGSARSFGLLVAVSGLFWTYYRGAVMEEKQFLENKDTVQGQEVGDDIRIEYLAYMRRVPYRWLPGVI
jgi:protein-S-isoprenylcysteine O-methyltransferase Ste14